MNEFKGTPGPWATKRISGAVHVYRLYKDGSGVTGPHAKVSCDMPGQKDEEDANARLIAAAPELLEAVSAFLCYVDSEDDDTESMLQFADALDKARAAHAKALGEPK